MVIAAPIRSLQARTIELHIEELVLDGFPAGDHVRIGEAIEQELRRLIVNDRGVADRSVAVDRVDAGAFAMGENAPPRTVGQNIARSVHAQLPALARARVSVPATGAAAVSTVSGAEAMKGVTSSR